MAKRRVLRPEEGGPRRSKRRVLPPKGPITAEHKAAFRHRAVLISDPGLADRICARITSFGVFGESAAVCEGVSARTYARWRSLAKVTTDETDPYYQFSERIDLAEAEWEQQQIRLITGLAIKKHDVANLIKILGLRIKARWGQEKVVSFDHGDMFRFLQIVAKRVGANAAEECMREFSGPVQDRAGAPGGSEESSGG